MRTQVPMQTPKSRSPSPHAYTTQWQKGMPSSSMSKNVYPPDPNTMRATSYRNNETIEIRKNGDMDTFASVQEMREHSNDIQMMSTNKTGAKEFSNDESAWRADFGIPSFESHPQKKQINRESQTVLQNSSMQHQSVAPHYVESREPHAQRQMMNSSPSMLMIRDKPPGKATSGMNEHQQNDFASSQQQRPKSFSRSDSKRRSKSQSPTLDMVYQSSHTPIRKLNGSTEQANNFAARDQSYKKIVPNMAHSNKQVPSQSQYQWHQHRHRHSTHSDEQQIRSDYVHQTQPQQRQQLQQRDAPPDERESGNYRSQRQYPPSTTDYDIHQSIIDELVAVEQQQQRHHRNNRTLQYWEEQQEEKSKTASRRQQSIQNSAFQVPDVSPLPNNSLADDILSPKSVESRQKSSIVSIHCHGGQNGAFSAKNTKQGERKNCEKKPGKAKNSIFEISNIFPSACSMPQTHEVEEMNYHSQAKEHTRSANRADESVWSHLDPNHDVNEYDEMSQSQDISESSDDDQDRYDEPNEETKFRTNQRRVNVDQPRKKISRQVVRPGEGDLRHAYDDLMLIDRTRKQNNPGRHHQRAQVQHIQYQASHDQERQRSYTSSTIGSGSNDSTFVSEFTGRQSPSLSQVREELWGNFGVAGHREAREPKINVASTRSGDGKRRSAREKSENRSEIPGRSNSSDVFDPFELVTTQHSFEGKVSENPDMPRRNKTLAPNKRVTRALSKANQHPRSYVDAREMQENSRHSGEDSDQGFFPFAPDFYMLEELGKEFSGKFTNQLATLNQASDFPNDQLEENGIDSSESSNSSVSTQVSDKETKTQKRMMEYLKRKSKKNVEKLKEFEQRQINDKGGLENGNNNVKLSSGLVEIDPEGVSNVEGGFKESLAVSAQRPPLAEELRELQRRKENFDGHYMYVAYSKFGTNAQEVLRLCEHEDMPLVNTRNGKVLVKVLASTISPIDCYIRSGKWNKMKLDPYIIPGVAFVGTIQNTGNMTFAHTFSNFKVGDTVMALVNSGSNARYTAVSRDRLVKVPPMLDLNKAVCLSETYLSAFQALHIGQRGSSRYRDKSLAGQTILVLGGSTSLGRALVEIAVAKGANYCYALGKERQFSTIRRMGGIPLPKDPLEWLTLIGRQITMMVAVKDSAGMYTDKLTKDHVRALTDEGRLVMIGFPGIDKDLPPFLAAPAKSHKLLCRSVKGSLQDRFHPYNVFESWDADSKQAKKDLEHLLRMLEHDVLKPDVLERVPLSKTSKVHAILENKKISGHIVCAPWINDEASQRNTKQSPLADGGLQFEF